MAFVATERINRPLTETQTSQNEFRVEHTGVIREIRLWVTDMQTGGIITVPDDPAYTFLINGNDVTGFGSNLFTPTENDVEYVRTGLNIAVVHGQKAVFYQKGGVVPNNILPIFIFETEIP